MGRGSTEGTQRARRAAQRPAPSWLPEAGCVSQSGTWTERPSRLRPGVETARVRGRAGHCKQRVLRYPPSPYARHCTSSGHPHSPPPNVALTWEGQELEPVGWDLVAGPGAAGRACGQRGDAEVHARPGRRGLGGTAGCEHWPFWDERRFPHPLSGKLWSLVVVTGCSAEAWQLLLWAAGTEPASRWSPWPPQQKPAPHPPRRRVGVCPAVCPPRLLPEPGRRLAAGGCGGSAGCLSPGEQPPVTGPTVRLLYGCRSDGTLGPGSSWSRGFCVQRQAEDTEIVCGHTPCSV